MAAAAGRALRIKYDADGAAGAASVVIAGARTDSLTINNTPIDVTDKDDSGVVTLLNDIGTKSISLSIEGVATDNTLGNLASAATASAALHYFEIVIASLRTYAGNFFISDFTYTGEDGDNPLSFSCTLTSSGAITES